MFTFIQRLHTYMGVPQIPWLTNAYQFCNENIFIFAWPPCIPVMHPSLWSSVVKLEIDDANGFNLLMNVCKKL